MNEFFVCAGMIVMLINIVFFFRVSKGILGMLEKENVKLKCMLSMNLLLLLLFFSGYSFVLYIMRNEKNSLMEFIIGQILFWGSIFVSISLNLEKRLSEILLVERLNETDSMTGLLNKIAFKKSVEIQLKKGVNNISMIMLDIDNFKKVNDIYGHLVGDELIKEVAKVVRNTLDVEYIISRFGGDEFVIFTRDIPKEGLIFQMKKLQREIMKISSTYNKVKISISIGVTFNKGENLKYEELLSRADTALYYVKNNGKNGYIFYEDIENKQNEMYCN